MAETLGLLVGFVPLIREFTAGINKLRNIRKSAENAPAELDALMRELECLGYLMQEANDKAPRIEEAVLQPCQASCDRVVKDLDALIQKLPTAPKIDKKAKVARLFAFRHWKEDVKALQLSIDGAKISLILYVQTCTVLFFLRLLTQTLLECLHTTRRRS